jgi:hypothetical protein
VGDDADMTGQVQCDSDSDHG